MITWKMSLTVLFSALTVAGAAAPPRDAHAETPTPEPDMVRGKIAFSLFNLGREAYEVQIVSTDGKERWIVTDEESVGEPALSPDGKRIAVRGWDRHRGIITFDLHGSGESRVSGHHEDSRPDWGAGGSIAFGSQRESDRLWRLYVNDDDVKWQDQALIGEDPSLSPNGDYFAYRGCDWDLNRCGLRTSERGGSRPTILTLDGEDISPDWSPDGKRIVFMSRRGAGNWDLYTLEVTPDGHPAGDGQPVRLTSDASNEGLPAWSPWGDAIAFVSDRSGVWAVYVMRGDGTDVRKVVDIGGTYDPPLHTVYGGRGLTNEQISWSR